MTQDAAGAPQFAIGRVLGTSCAVLSRNVVPFGILALILGLLTVLTDWASGGIEQVSTLSVTSGGGNRAWFSQILSWLASVAIGNLVTAAVIYGVFQDLRGRRASIGACLSHGVAAILPVVIASILFAILVGLATVLLVIPGIMVWLAYWLFVPAIVVEKRGIIDSLNRSAFLTRGRRWAVVGLWLVVGVVALLVFALLSVVPLLLSLREAIPVLAYVWQAVLAAFTAVMTAVSYYYLRVDKEGVAIDEIAAIFD